MVIGEEEDPEHLGHQTSKSGQGRATSRLFVWEATDMTGGSLHLTLFNGTWWWWCMYVCMYHSLCLPLCPWSALQFWLLVSLRSCQMHKDNLYNTANSSFKVSTIRWSLGLKSINEKQDLLPHSFAASSALADISSRSIWGWSLSFCSISFAPSSVFAGSSILVTWAVVLESPSPGLSVIGSFGEVSSGPIPPNQLLTLLVTPLNMIAQLLALATR